MEINICIRLEEKQEDAALAPAVAARMRDGLKSALDGGSIFLEASNGTCVHAALNAIRGRIVFAPTGMQHLVWPAPGKASRYQPVHAAKELFKLFDAYYQSNFPGFEDALFNFTCAPRRISWTLQMFWITYGQC